MRVLGIDPGTGILGFGLIEASNHNLTLVDAGVIRTPYKERCDPALSTITYNELTEIIKNSQPKVMVVEKLFFAQNVTTAMTVSQARGIVLLCAEQAKLQIFEYTPSAD